MTEHITAIRRFPSDTLVDDVAERFAPKTACPGPTMAAVAPRRRRLERNHTRRAHLVPPPS